MPYSPFDDRDKSRSAGEVLNVKTNQSGVNRGFEAISPQMVTGFWKRLASKMVILIMRIIPGCVG